MTVYLLPLRYPHEKALRTGSVPTRCFFFLIAYFLNYPYKPFYLSLIFLKETNMFYGAGLKPPKVFYCRIDNELMNRSRHRLKQSPPYRCQPEKIQLIPIVSIKTNCEFF